jgi:hypothetical protein
MRSLVRWMAGLLSIAALAKLLGRRRRTSAPQVEPDTGVGPDPADELRRKLDEVRASSTATAAPEPGASVASAPASTGTSPAEEPVTGGDPAGEGGPSSPTLEERRAAIHARAQEAIDAMTESDA